MLLLLLILNSTLLSVYTSTLESESKAIFL